MNRSSKGKGKGNRNRGNKDATREEGDQKQNAAGHSHLAYHEPSFLDSNEARPLRIMAEYLDPLRRLQDERVHDTVVFFGSARLTETGPMGLYYRDARELARCLTAWSMTLPGARRFVVCSGGGGGIMEAANRGAADAGGRTIGFNIGLPHEQRPNPYVPPELSFEFHYFFMRKLWFSYLARAMVVFPGGFGTLDETFEFLTLTQTRKLEREIPIVLYGSAYWNEIVNFDALVRHDVIDRDDLRLFSFADDPQTVLSLLQTKLPVNVETASPALAKSRIPRPSRR
ncbi:MAG TPA: TIGR00730 family Rossman fold protein [Polyangia bacterium]|jgi:hypothetical protein|nr:TIGR00730 family Rossman fold protein [Polyangia bacterium]